MLIVAALSSVNQKFSKSSSVFIFSHFTFQTMTIWSQNKALRRIYSAMERKTSLVSDGNRTEDLNVKSSSQEPVSQFLKTLIIVELFSVRPLSFLLAALQISLLFLWMASLLHAALFCLSFTLPPSRLLSVLLSTSTLY